MYSLREIINFLKDYIKQLRESMNIAIYERQCSQAELSDNWFRSVGQALVKKDHRFLAKHLVTSELWLKVTKRAICEFAVHRGYSGSIKRITGKGMARVINYLTDIPEALLYLCVEENKASEKMEKYASLISSSSESKDGVIKFIKKVIPAMPGQKITEKNNRLLYTVDNEGNKSDVFFVRYRVVVQQYLNYLDRKYEINQHLGGAIV